MWGRSSRNSTPSFSSASMPLPSSRRGSSILANWDDYAERLSELFLTRTQAEWCAILEGTDACFAPVVPLDEAKDHPHMQARECFVEHGGRWHTAPAPRFSRTPGTVRDSAEDGEAVVESWARER